MDQTDAVRTLMVICIFILGFAFLKAFEPMLVYSPKAETITFTNHLKPIIMKRCMPCHTGSIQTLPNFTIYDVAFKKRIMIKHRVWAVRNMPPGGNITKEEREKFKTWVDQGAKK